MMNTVCGMLLLLLILQDAQAILKQLEAAADGQADA